MTPTEANQSVLGKRSAKGDGHTTGESSLNMCPLTLPSLLLQRAAPCHRACCRFVCVSMANNKVEGGVINPAKESKVASPASDLGIWICINKLQLSPLLLKTRLELASLIPLGVTGSLHLKAPCREGDAERHTPGFLPKSKKSKEVTIWMGYLWHQTSTTKRSKSFS